MNRLILGLMVGTSLAFVGLQVAHARGTGGASHGGSHQGQPHSGQAHSSQQHSGQQHSGQQHSGQQRSGGQHQNGAQSGKPHNVESQGAHHGSQVSLPTDGGFGGSSGGSHGAGAVAAKNKSAQPSGAAGAAAGATAAKNKSPQASGAAGAAAGAAAAKNKGPQVSGAAGATAGAAAAKNKSPQVSGAAGAAAGVAAAKNNSPQVSGAAGAAAGAAAARNNSPQVSGAAGAAAGAAAARNNSPQVSGAAGAVAGATVANRTAPVSNSVAFARGAAVRNSFNHPDVFGQHWYGDHPGAWNSAAWASGATWNAATWPAVGAWYGWGSSTQPVSYDYGNSVVYQGDQVYSGGQSVASADEYYQAASTLAQSVPAADPNSGQWLPLGIFAIVQGDQTDTSKVFQLALDKSGRVGGNYSDLLTDTTLPIQGAVDQQTQRVAWTVGQNKHNVWDTGLSNLTKEQAPVLVHIGKDKTQQWLLVRLKQPE